MRRQGRTLLCYFLDVGYLATVQRVAMLPDSVAVRPSTGPAVAVPAVPANCDVAHGQAANCGGRARAPFSRDAH